MNEPTPSSESAAPVFEQKSSVKVGSNAKGEAQVEVKAVEGVTAGQLADLRALAVGEYLEAMRALRPTAVPGPGVGSGGTAAPLPDRGATIS